MDLGVEGVELGLYGALYPARCIATPLPHTDPARYATLPAAPHAHHYALWDLSGYPGFLRSCWCPLLTLSWSCLPMPSSFLFRGSCGAVIPAFDDIFICATGVPSGPSLLSHPLNLTGVGPGSPAVWASPQV